MYKGKNSNTSFMYIITACETRLDAQFTLGLRQQTEVDECPIRSGDSGRSDATKRGNE